MAVGDAATTTARALPVGSMAIGELCGGLGSLLHDASTQENVMPPPGEDLDPTFWAKLFGYVTVTGIATAQGAIVRTLGGSAAMGFETGAFGLLFRRAAFTVAPFPIKVASLVLTGMNFVVKRPLGGLVYFGPEAMKRAIQCWGPQTSAPLPEIVSLPDASSLVISPGTSVIDKVSEGLSASDTVKYILGPTVAIGSVYLIYRLYNRRPSDDPSDDE